MPFATCSLWLDSLLRNLVYVACVVEDIRYEEEPPEPDVEVIFLTYFLSFFFATAFRIPHASLFMSYAECEHAQTLG